MKTLSFIQIAWPQLLLTAMFVFTCWMVAILTQKISENTKIVEAQSAVLRELDARVKQVIK